MEWKRIIALRDVPPSMTANLDFMSLKRGQEAELPETTAAVLVRAGAAGYAVN